MTKEKLQFLLPVVFTIGPYVISPQHASLLRRQAVINVGLEMSTHGGQMPKALGLAIVAESTVMITPTMRMEGTP